MQHVYKNALGSTSYIRYFFNLSFVRFFQYDLLQKDRNFSVSLFLACYVQLDL